MPDKAYNVRISGRVTGVGFRWATLDKSSEFPSLKGYVRNVGSGEVEAFIQGDEAELEAMLQWLSVGPPFARVDRIEKISCQRRDEISTFEIR